ncbi:MAG: sulfur carrier protein ThiS adenylyltransferase ThiF [Thermoguttaceae bacterium]|nr:sulfur carrier protein ThiS adenylyltransferase ThiF [Thermoguttaceae bacterium]
MAVTEADFARAVDCRSGRPVYRVMKQARVGIAGLGGLGSNIAAALARSGVGHLTLVDFDKVELSNLNRQLYGLPQLGKTKVSAISEILPQINPFCRITARNVRVTAENCADLFAGCGIIVEAFDLPEQKAMLVNTIMEKMPDKHVVCGSGMAGFGSANTIVTRYVTEKLTVCGDGVSDVANGVGLTAARVMVCAGHMATRVMEIILGQ